ncbi:E3 ubiquitin-protein ligase DCST1 isoform X2 [Clinocottus analis]|uniref:E3 ubiquitin-protein ligase DCST1 isoform X2 n=1 Tax=Clinocottus analis TaxID=304258 RepID=UPI0035C1BED3
MAPRSTLEKLSLRVLPAAAHRFLFGPSEGLVVAHLLLRALFGAVSGTGLFLGVSHNLPLTFDQKLLAAAVFSAVCAVGGALSSSCRCSVLLMFPSMLGSRGRAYLMLLMLSVLYRGPIFNIQRNVESAALSLSCNLDLQVYHSRLLWREAVKPFVLITQQLMDDETEFESEAQDVSTNFQNIRDEVVLQYGYDKFKHTPNGTSTQDQFTYKTMMQCNSVVEEGVKRCVDWFRQKWADCMKAIPVPVIDHILCVSMKFHFLCDIMRVMTPWCRDQIPVEGNFGSLFDRLNLSVDLLSREFSTSVVLKEQQEVLDGALLDKEFTRVVRASFLRLTASMDQLLRLLQLLLSFTFITLFTQGVGYLLQYRRDVRFDNLYVTTYFRQIDARRKKAGKRCLLPLKQQERKNFIEPWSLRVHPQELMGLTSGVFQVLSVSLLSVLLLTVDFSLFHVLDIVSRHTFTQFNLTSSHQVDIRVGGASMMARLLRKTVSAFNSSSSFHIQTDNQACVCVPSPPPSGVYISCVCCILLVALFSCVQVYTNRLHRVITAFYHPQREKRRVLFLYNLQIQRRAFCPDRKCIPSRTVFQRLTRCLHRRQEAPPTAHRL